MHYDARFKAIDIRIHLDETIPGVHTVEDRLFACPLSADALPRIRRPHCQFRDHSAVVHFEHGLDGVRDFK